MKKNIILSEDGENAYGRTKDFPRKEVFISEIKKQVEGIEDVVNVKIESCISTEEGLPAEWLIPISATDIVIESYWVAELHLSN